MKKRTFLAALLALPTLLHTFGSPTCGAETLPVTDFDFCEPEVALSEIQRVFLAKVAADPFTDWTQSGEWTERVSETSLDRNAIRAFTVIGDKPLPTKQTREISGGRRRHVRKTHIINFTVDDVTNDNHAFLQQVENGQNFRMWYETAGGYMFGGNEGILCEVSGDMQLNRGQGEIKVYNYVAQWDKSRTENRCQSPIFAQTLLGSATFDTTVTFASDATPEVGDCDFVLAGGTDEVAKFEYNDVNPTIGASLIMVIKVATVTILTCNMKTDFAGQSFRFTDENGDVYEGIITAGNVNF